MANCHSTFSHISLYDLPAQTQNWELWAIWPQQSYSELYLAQTLSPWVEDTIHFPFSFLPAPTPWRREMGLVGWIVLAAFHGFAMVMNGILDIHSTAVPGGRPVVQVCGLCSNSALALCVEIAWPVLFLPGQSCCRWNSYAS